MMQPSECSLCRRSAQRFRSNLIAENFGPQLKELNMYNILIVDDSSTIRKIIIRCIQHTQIAVGKLFEAGDGEQALSILEVETIHLVMTDINMPKMNGMELLSRLKSDDRWKDLPVLLITTEGRVDTVLEAANKGAAGYVKKPFTASDIQAKIEPLLNAIPA
jgi:two-component system chemotaxis response regulator CheY